jgi:arylsulfatase A-like enzyme
VLDDLIDSVDFMPTMAAAGDARAPKPCDGQSFLPQLRGEKGNPRDHLFWHYDPRPGWDKKPYRLHRFACDKRYKLYDDGRMYDVPADALEERPLATDVAPAVTAKLKAVLERHRA